MAAPSSFHGREQRLGSSVSFSRSRGPSQQTEDDDDDIQFSFAPYIQTYLAHSGQRVGCCGVCLPILFERAARQSWWDPRFDSEILEGQYRRSSFPQVRLRFQYALLYILAVSLSWFVYFIVTGLQGATHHWVAIGVTFAILFVVVGTVLFLTCTDVYRRYTVPVSLLLAVVITTLSLAFAVLSSEPPDITPAGQFGLCIEILLVIYTVVPLPLYASVGIGGIYSVAFELLSANLGTAHGAMDGYGTGIRILLHLCVHFVGIHILIMTHVRMRGTFMKVGQSLLVRKQLEMEKQLKEKMIHSVMPPKVAAWLMSETGGGREEEGGGGDTLKSYRTSNPAGNDIRSLFRPFNMHCMENVSILFADIVGFTRMSSNKSAEELVGILNGLFERFDDLCATHGCEKISTLGDCYYCVAGCPEPKPDHAKSCVEMGLGMIDAIKQFDAERNEGVNMRVGVHTGTVLCGIVGTRRFKFDVWSNDVTLANQMESTGKPGRVHVSEATCTFLGDMYLLEEGEEVHGIKSYFIEGRKADISYEMFLRQEKPTPETLRILVAPPSTPPLFPKPRSRVLSCIQPQGKRPHYLHLMTSVALTNHATRVTCSLPSILDSDNDLERLDDSEMINPDRSPTSLSTCGKFSPRAKPWIYPTSRFRGKSEERQPLGLKHAIQSSPPSKRSEVNLADTSYQQLPQLDISCEDDRLDDVAVDQLEVPVAGSNEDQLSVCLSINSRKDSGIRSTSRRSSIQQQIFVMNGMAQGELMTHRVSGYYTSSQSTLSDTDQDKRNELPGPLSDNLGLCFHKLRKQSDLQLIRCVQDNVKSHRSYFVTPPLSGLTLFFRQRDMEREYRTHAHRINEKHGDSPPTLATSRYNTYFDVLVSALVFVAVAVSLFLLYTPSPQWVSLCIVASTVQVFAVLLCVRQLLWPKLATGTVGHKDMSRKILDTFSEWYPWHACGGLLVSLPVVSVLINFPCDPATDPRSDFYYGYLMFVGLLHFCNFTQLNCWMKSVLASLAGVSYVALVASHACPRNSFAQIPSSNMTANVMKAVPILDSTLSATKAQYDTSLYHSEIFLDVVLLLMLVWFLNREFEISYRLSFHGNVVAARDKTKVQSMKNQADWLLHNIIPKHVADQLKNTAKYSENHRDVGVIFASIVNFNEMYDESYLGGKEYLRVLNELIGDFDELLTKPEFKDIEKIKTIGSTFMAASGLNPEVRRQSRHPHDHLFQLMDFAMALQKVIDDFNRDLLEFNLVLRVGYNFGDVTAGVIGTTKLYYDIWGDAVNIASRMDSTGVRGRIQVGCDCIPVLSERYEFEPRGSVYVKGKDNMTVFLLKGKREDINIDDG